MNKRNPPLWLTTVLLIVALVWRMVGAPLQADEWLNLKIPLRQAGVQLPFRISRILTFWFADKVKQEDKAGEKSEKADPQAQPVWLSVYQTEEGTLTRMSLSGYVCGVVAAEMPATYHLEALKAQAVAARTRALAQIGAEGCSKYPGADICTDSSHCQGYDTLAECQERWRDSYEIYRTRIQQAEKETAGQWLSYGNKPIDVFYHAISGGKTEDAQTVFSQSYPYLVSVDSNGEEAVRGYQQDTTMSYEEIKQKLSVQLSSEEIRRSFTIGSYSAAGRVQTVNVGERVFTGTEIRNALGLRSTWFSITMNDDGITFHQKGYGHGVGMSQAGANVMAAEGSDYLDILFHYYPGVEIKTGSCE